MDAAQQRVDMLVEGDRLGGADRQCMAEAEQQPARFVEPAPFRFGYVPVFRQLGSPGVGAELLHASVGQGPRIERSGGVQRYSPCNNLSKC